MKYFHSFS